jgi:Ca2+-transporting ATPase
MERPGQINMQILQPVETQTAPWHALATDAALERAQSLERGLTEAEVALRRAQYGPNVLEQQSGESLLSLLWRQINSPLIWVLIGAASLAVALGKVTDGLVVLSVVVLNALIGFVQEWRASRAIASLAGMVPENAIVLREGRQRAVPVSELVPGDIVLLAAGDRIPADVRLLSLKGLQVEEAALTGESVPVPKITTPVGGEAALGDRLCMAYSGSLVTSGTGIGLVVATGSQTELGRISNLMHQTTELQTPLTRNLGTLGRYITLAIGIVALLLFIIGMLRATGHGLATGQAARDTLLFAISLAVGAIPEGLPAVVTIALAIGVQRMAARRAIIRHLPAVETLGSTTVICSDKTGTLTRNEMMVVAVWTTEGLCRVSGVGYEPKGAFLFNGTERATPPSAVHHALEIAALCNDAAVHAQKGQWQIVGDPTEAALVVAAEKAGIDTAALREAQTRLDVIPFDSETKFMATLHAGTNGARRVLLKGAPEVVLARCRTFADGTPIDAADVLREVEQLAQEGMRVLALAEKPWTHSEDVLETADAAHDFALAGLVGMIDPPRPEAIAAIQRCHEAGIVVKMITGDHHATAQAIGQQLGLASETPALTGSALNAMNAQELREAARQTAVFARVAPEHKLQLVQALQSEGHVVAMTGDGVNDAPALKQADIGVAMGITGTSVSKEAAALVLTDDNFASITAAVEEGRRVYDNLIKSLAFILPTNLGLALILTCAVLFFPFDPATNNLLLPMQPAQLLWINLVATVSLALPLAFEKAEADVMRRPPRAPDQPILSQFLVIRTLLAALLMTAGAVGLFYWEYQTALREGTLAEVLPKTETMVVTSVILFQIFYLLECRSLRRSVLQIGLFSNPVVFLGIGALLVLQGFFIYLPFLNRVFGSAPIHLGDILMAALVGIIILPVVAFEKWLRARGKLPFSNE